MSHDSTEGHPPLIGVYGLSHARPQESRNSDRLRDSQGWILEDLSTEIRGGEFIALMGPNGCGKSTLLKILAGVLPIESSMSSGLIKYRGTQLHSFSMHKRAQLITYVAPDFSSEFPLTVEEAVALGRISYRSSLGINSASEKEKKIINEALDLCQCSLIRHRELRSLSGGERQLVGLARALAQESRILLLDEALSKMDLNHQVLMGKLLTQLVKKGSSVVLVSHDLNLASEWADRLWLMKKGKLIYDGSLCEGLTQENLERLYPHTPLLVMPHPQGKTLKVFFA